MVKWLKTKRRRDPDSIPFGNLAKTKRQLGKPNRNTWTTNHLHIFSHFTCLQRNVIQRSQRETEFTDVENASSCSQSVYINIHTDGRCLVCLIHMNHFFKIQKSTCHKTQNQQGNENFNPNYTGHQHSTQCIRVQRTWHPRFLTLDRSIVIIKSFTTHSTSSFS